ncbi:MAG: tetraacyldisaccharide 4'-kinase, partial [Flavobacteriaceae bacterium]|nr:tetraacyldisaccharide 4'-kinase [Flavobacteriaceae bacterium]
MHIVRLLLFPFSLIYGSLLFLRNKFFDWGIFASDKGELPTLLIGNLNTGGTGKTPHTIHLAKALESLHPAILSRGYGRKSKGYFEIEAGMNPEISGDEPQLYLEAGIAPVAVCENRLLGIHELKKSGHQGIVILDDALQHRSLKPDYCILMVPGKRPYYKDFYLPSGDLRDHKISARRADAVIISEAPDHLDLVSCRRKLSLEDDQLLFKSKVIYFEPEAWGHQTSFDKNRPVVLLTAIAKAHRPSN